MKPTPTCSMQRATCSASRSRWMPATAKRSALPEEDETPRLPCLATCPPAAATTKLEAVETLNRLAPSPPVPTMSTRWSASRCTGFISSRITWAAALISSAVSPFTAIPIKNAAICGSLSSPVMIWPMIAWVSAKVRFSRRISAPRPSLICILHLPTSGSVQRRCGATLEKVCQQFVALAGQDRLRMELHTLDIQLTVAQPHDQPRCDIVLVGHGGNFETRRKRLDSHHQRVITGDCKRIFQTGKNPLPAMTDMRCLAVQRLGCTHDVTSVGLSNGLVSKTDSQNRQTTGKMADGGQRNTRLVGCTRTGGNHQVSGQQCFDLFQRDGVVAV